MLGYKLDRNLERQLIRGQVGDSAQADFAGYLEVASEMPDPHKVLAGTHTDIPEKPQVLYALCAALAHYASGKNAKNLVAYLTSIPNKEFAAFTIKDALSRNPSLKTNDHITAWFFSEGKALLL